MEQLSHCSVLAEYTGRYPAPVGFKKFESGTSLVIKKPDLIDFD